MDGIPALDLWDLVMERSVSFFTKPIQGPKDQVRGNMSLYCAQKNSLTICTRTMAKRMQEQEGDHRIVAKSKPTINLVSLVSTSSSTVQNPVASKSPVILKAPCRTDWSSTGKFDAKEHNHAASSSQGWQKDAILDVGTGKLVVPGNSECNDEDLPHNVHISTIYVLHVEKVFSIVRQDMVSARRIK